jgi:hypothetical protein
MCSTCWERHSARSQAQLRRSRCKWRNIGYGSRFCASAPRGARSGSEVPSGLAPDPEWRHRSALVSGIVVRRRRAYRGGRRPSGHRSPVDALRARAPCAGWPVGKSRALRRGRGRSERRWCGFGSLASAGSALLLPGDLVRYTINSTSVTLTDPDAAPRLGREALLALARWMAQGDERSGSSRSPAVDGPSERATGSDPRGAAQDGVAPSPAGTASPGGGR